jgi:hypothetical protein
MKKTLFFFITLIHMPLFCTKDQLDSTLFVPQQSYQAYRTLQNASQASHNAEQSLFNQIAIAIALREKARHQNNSNVIPQLHKIKNETIELGKLQIQALEQQAQAITSFVQTECKELDQIIGVLTSQSLPETPMAE